MRKSRFQKIIWIIFFCFNQKVYGLADFKFNGTEVTKVTPLDSKDLTHKNSNADLLKVSDEQLTEEALLAKMEKYDNLAKQGISNDNLLSLHLNRAVCYIQLARVTRIKSGGSQISIKEDQYLKKSLLILEKLLELKKISNLTRGKIEYFQGISYLDLGLKSKAYESFNKSINTSSENSFVPSLSLFIADMEYEDNKLEQAKKTYKVFYERMNQQEKDLADYKVAWINMNQSMVKESLDILFKLIETSKSASIVQDSILSSSIALSINSSQEEIIERIEREKFSESVKFKILYSVYEKFLSMSQKNRFRIWEKLFEYEKSDENYFKLISMEFQNFEFKGKIKEEISLLKKIQSGLVLKAKDLTKLPELQQVSLRQDVERLISVSVDNYKKSKSDDNYEVAMLAIDLFIQLDFKERSEEVYSLQLDFLSEKSDPKKVFLQCEEIIKKTKSQKLQDKAKLLVLLNYEKLVKEKPDLYKEQFLKYLEAYLKNENAEQWLSVASKYSDYLVASKKTNEAEELAIKIFIKDPSAENLNRLVVLKFENKKCKDVIELLSKVKNQNSKAKNYERECYLNFALESKSAIDDKSKYIENILKFISLSEGSKKHTAISDLLTSLQDETDDSYKTILSKMLEEQFYHLRYEKEIFPVYKNEVLKLVDESKFENAEKYLIGCEEKAICKDRLALKNKLTALRNLDEKNVNEKDFLKGDKEIYLKYLPLIRPELFISQVKSKLWEKTDNKYILVSARLSNLDFLDSKNLEVYNKISSILDKDERGFMTSKSVLKIKKINFPSKIEGHHLRDQDVLNLIKQTQGVRQSVVSDLSLYGIEGKKYILNQAVLTEIKMEATILNSPLPKNLPNDKIVEYKNGLKKLSEEFRDQSQNYQQSLLELEKQKSESSLINFESLKIPPNPEDWNWGGTELYEQNVKKLIKEEKFAHALFYLDYLSSQNKISIEDYYKNRSGVLLFSAKNREKTKSMIKYIYNECQANKQMGIFETWFLQNK